VVSRADPEGLFDAAADFYYTLVLCYLLLHIIIIIIIDYYVGSVPPVQVYRYTAAGPRTPGRVSRSLFVFDTYIYIIYFIIIIIIIFVFSFPTPLL